MRYSSRLWQWGACKRGPWLLRKAILPRKPSGVNLVLFLIILHHELSCAKYLTTAILWLLSTGSWSIDEVFQDFSLHHLLFTCQIVVIVFCSNFIRVVIFFFSRTIALYALLLFFVDWLEALCITVDEPVGFLAWWKRVPIESTTLRYLSNRWLHLLTVY